MKNWGNLRFIGEGMRGVQIYYPIKYHTCQSKKLDKYTQIC